MRKLFLLTVLSAGVVLAQTAETRIFRAILSPANEVPPIAGLNATGAGTVTVHVVRNAAGEIISGSADFYANFTFPGAVTITGMHIHNGPAGANASVTIDSGIRGADPVVVETGRGTLSRQGQVPVDASANAIATLRGLWTDPSQFYLNIHTTVNPGGAIRGQLMQAESAVFIGQMSNQNENPPVPQEVSALGTVIVLVTRDAGGAINSGEVIFDINYNFPTAVTLTGLHVHTGGATVNGPVTLNSGLTGQVPSEESGRGRINLRNEMNVANAATYAALEGVFVNPAGFYVNLHTTQFTGGAARSQLRRTDSMQFNVNMTTGAEVPPVTGIDASAPAVLTAHTLRDAQGRVEAGYVVFDVNHRFPADQTFVGLHVHDGAADATGPVRLNTGINAANPVTSATGFGNIYRGANINDTNGLATLNSLVADPSKHYLNLHTTQFTGGAVRAQLGSPRTGRPTVGAVIASADPAVRTAAPGGLISIYGANFANVTTDSSGWAGTVPPSLNGVTVTVDGRPAPLLFVSGTQINAQVPLEVTAGSKPVVVKVNDQTSDAFNTTIAANAPAIFIYSAGGIAVKNADFSLIGPGNPARAGDIIVVFSTGFGQTTPALQSGVPAGASPFANTAATTATIGNQSAEVIYSIASPGFVGLYQTALRVPAGVAAGNAPLVLRVAGQASNSVNIAVQ